jgi:peptidoglycan/LPS O-acetylase OafA/YrhL
VAVLAWFHLGHARAGGGFGFGPSVFGYPLLALAFAVLTLSALSPGSPLHRWRVPGAAALAAGSYAMYLVHKPVFSAAHPLLQALGLEARGAAGAALLAALSLLPRPCTSRWNAPSCAGASAAFPQRRREHRLL